MYVCDYVYYLHSTIIAHTGGSGKVVQVLCIGE